MAPWNGPKYVHHFSERRVEMYAGCFGTLLINYHYQNCMVWSTARVLASQAEAIVRTGKHGHNIE